MVEVFKTNVRNQNYADKLIRQIHNNFTHYRANFDLEDPDNILRVACDAGPVKAPVLISFLNKFGFTIEPLPDHCHNLNRHS